MLPLDGILVVALEQVVAVPFATRQLADLGARVIKIERPGGGDFARGFDAAVHGQSSYFVWLNRGKESIELDLKSERGQQILSALLGRADVFVQNLAPGAAGRLGLAAGALRERYPRLITCSVSGYGPGGPYEHKKAYDLLIQCEAGLLSVTGAGDEPAKAGISVADIAAGMYTYTGILTALYERERTGLGTSFDVAMLEALGEWMSQPFYYSVYGGQQPLRTGARHASISPYGPYTVAGGGQVFLGLQNDREWAVLCDRVLHRPGLITDPRFAANPDRVANDEALTAIIEGALAGLTPDQAVALLDEAGIASARLRTPAQFAAHPQLQARDRWREVPSPAGPVRTMLPPVTVAGREAAMGAIPAAGQHTAAILAEFGLAGSGGTEPGGAESFGAESDRAKEPGPPAAGMPSVLVLGIDPHAVPGMDGDAMRAVLDQELARFGELGIDAEMSLMALGGPAGPAVTAALAARDWDVVVIGGGIRKPGPLLELFEIAVNLIRQHAPGAAIAFNTSGGDSVAAARRWLAIS